MFAERLKKLRKDRGWSQDEFAERVGIHGRHVGKYETGRTLPNADTLIKIANVFGVSIDYLLRDDMDQSAITSNLLSDQELLKKFAAVEKMSAEDKHVVTSLIDAYIKKQQIEAVLQQ